MDADEAGRRAAQRIERDLTAVARTVTIADLAPERHDGYDLTDWLDSHRTVRANTLRLLFVPDPPPNGEQPAS